MKLLLDIDGVLNITPSWKSCKIMDDGFLEFDLNSVNNLNQILKMFDLNIVLTSSHRVVHNLSEMNLFFKNRGIIQKINSFLPNTGLNRLDEITLFLSENRIYDFIILDDDKKLNGLNKKIKRRLILTNPLIGFNYIKLKKCENIIING